MLLWLIARNELTAMRTEGGCFMTVDVKTTVTVLLRLLLLGFLGSGVLVTPAVAHCGCAHDLPPEQSGFTAAAGGWVDDTYPETIDAPVVLPSGISRLQVEDRTYQSYATEVMDNLITYGTDRYGSVQSDLLVSNLDVRTKNNPLAADLAEADMNVRMLRQGRRAPGGSNFLHNQPIYRAMNRASQVTGDGTYADFVDDNMDWALTNLINGDGTLQWGWHRHYDVHTDVKTGHAGSPHEIHGMDAPLWEQMWNHNSSTIETAITSMWNGHVRDKTTGAINRHNNSGDGTFAMSYSALIEAFAFMSVKSPGIIAGQPAATDTWIERAKLLEDFVWDGRDTTTNLIPDSAQVTQYWNGVTVSTTMPGVYVPGLIRAYEHTGDTYFRDRALTYLDAWGTYAYDTSTDNFWGSLDMNGSPRPLPRIRFNESAGTDRVWEPRGYIDMWAPLGETMEHFPDTAQFFAKAHADFNSTGSLSTPLLTTAERWAAYVRKNMPANQTDEGPWYNQYSKEWAKYGTYAEHYGRTIDFFLTMYEETGDNSYLLSARDMAKDSIAALWFDGLLRGHAAKPYYEAIDGVGLLLEALVDLGQYDGNFTKFGDFDGDGDVDDADFNNFMRLNMDTTVSAYTDGDVDGDGLVTLIDFDRFKYEYYEGTSALSLGVPEPSSVWLLSSAGAIALLRRRRSNIRRVSTSELHCPLASLNEERIAIHSISRTESGV